MKHTSEGILKHFLKLILTPASNLKYVNYWRQANFGYTQLTNIKAIHRLLNFDENLAQTYPYYQAPVLTVPTSLQKVQWTLRQHKKEIFHSFKYETYTNGPVEGTNNKIKVIKRIAYGFRNFADFRISFLLSLPLTGRISKQPAPKFRHELLNKTILFF